MKNSDEAIEQVLAALREAEAPVGMERRILETLEEKASSQVGSGWRRLRPIWLTMPARPVATRFLACGVASAGLFAIGLAIYSIHAIRRPGHLPTQSKMAPASVGSLPPATSGTVASSAQLVPHETSVPSIGRPDTEEKPNARRARANSTADSVALQEMLAVSYPAPPMPLTEQEKLLLRIAHRSDPVELAILEPMLRTVQDAEEKEEFQRFFEQPATKQPATEPSVLPTAEQKMPEQPTTEQPTSTQPTPAKPTTGDNK
jgi:hypothetical protein